MHSGILPVIKDWTVEGPSFVIEKSWGRNSQVSQYLQQDEHILDEVLRIASCLVRQPVN